MTPAYLNPQPSPFPIDQFHEVSSSSSSSLSCPIFSNLTQDQGGCYHGELQLLGHPREVDMLVSLSGSYEPPKMEDKSKIEMKFPTWTTGEIIRNEIQSENNGSCKWMPLKMRIVRKMMTGDRTDPEITPSFGDHKQLSCPFETEKSGNNNSSNINTNTAIRVCADCYTTKTPLWRSGPRGPKSLCNACGIRQRKARRAMAAAAAAAAVNGTILATNVTSNVKTAKVQQRDKKPGKGFNSTTQYKKRCKLTSAASCPSSGGQKRLRFEDFTISLSKKYAAFHRVFPQDEKEEAAILLMALSCGLVCS